MEHSRRDYLRSAGVLALGVLAGCNGGDAGTTTEPQAVGPRADSSSETETPSPTPSPQPDANAETETAAEQTETPGTPSVRVAQDGSGDYERLSAAEDAVRPGDRIIVAAGEYAYTPTRPVTLEGASTDATTVTIEGLGTDRNPYYSGREPFEAVDLTIGLANADFLRPTPVVFENARVTAPVLATDVTARDTVFEESVEAVDLSVTDATCQSTVTYHALDGADTTFESDLVFESPDNATVSPGLSLAGSVVQGETTFAPTPDADSEADVTGTTFGEHCHLETATTADFEDCTINTLQVAGGADCTVTNSEVLAEVVDRPAIEVDAVPADADIEAGRTTIGRSTVEGGELNVAIHVEEGTNALTVRNSTIRGRCAGNLTADGTFRRNTFRRVGGFDYFMEVFDPGFCTTNAFLGADVLVVSRDTRMYSIRNNRGNYYSTYDEADEDGDGIIDVPRSIPGDTVSDPFPLASSNLDRY